MAKSLYCSGNAARDNGERERYLVGTEFAKYWSLGSLPPVGVVGGGERGGGGGGGGGGHNMKK